MLCDDSKAKEYPSIISSLKEARSLLSNIHDSIFTDSLPTYITSFNEICSDKSFTSTKVFLGVSKQIVTEDKREYSPSNGERGILLLQQKLSREADAYFLDEPELGMGNSYIDSNIRPIISDLAKRHKIVVVATHNANLAVRTLPYMSIFRAHKNGDYFTYTGNPFNDALININDSSDFLNWTVESMHTLEGGKEAFYERKNIYESNSN